MIYLFYILARFKVLFAYRLSVLSGILMQLFWGSIKISILSAFYNTKTTTSMSFQQALTYVWLGQAFFAMLPNNADPELQNMIKNGNLSYEHIKPLSIHGMWYSRCLGAKLGSTLIRASILLPIAFIFLGISKPPCLFFTICSIISILISFILSASITTFLTVTLIWTTSGEGMNKLLLPLTLIFSGNVIPLSLMPPKLISIIKYMPFRCLIDVPFSIYLGMLSQEEAIMNIGIQLGWCCMFTLVNIILFQQAKKDLVFQGG